MTFIKIIKTGIYFIFSAVIIGFTAGSIFTGTYRGLDYVFPGMSPTIEPLTSLCVKPLFSFVDWLAPGDPNIFAGIIVFFVIGTPILLLWKFWCAVRCPCLSLCPWRCPCPGSLKDTETAESKTKNGRY